VRFHYVSVIDQTKHAALAHPSGVINAAGVVALDALQAGTIAVFRYELHEPKDLGNFSNSVLVPNYAHDELDEGAGSRVTGMLEIPSHKLSGSFIRHLMLCMIQEPRMLHDQVIMLPAMPNSCFQHSDDLCQ
jgi:hypothetical protein